MARKRIIIEVDVAQNIDKRFWYTGLLPRLIESVRPMRIVYCAVEDVVEPDVIAGYRKPDARKA